MIIDDPFKKNLDVGDLVRHPVTGHIGVLLGPEPGGIWLVEWISEKQGSMLTKRIRTAEYDSVLCLLTKAAAA